LAEKGASSLSLVVVQDKGVGSGIRIAILESMNKDCTVAFIIGAAAGAIIGLLSAPSAGTETRRLIANKAKQGVDELQGRANLAMDSANQMLDKTRAELNRQQDALKNAVDAGKKAYQETAASPIPVGANA
jgi:gas vesicle protein